VNEAERSHFLDALRSDDDFRAAVRRELLTEELLALPQTVATLVDVVAQQRQDFTALAQSVANYMERTLAVVQEGNEAVRDAISALRGELVSLESRTDAGFTVVDARFDQIGAEIGDLKADIRGIKDQLG
jgi:hypothetical protein